MARRHSKVKLAIGVLAVVIAAYGLMAYIVLPLAWSHYEHQKGLAGRPMVTRTAQDIPGESERKMMFCAPCTQLRGTPPIRLRSGRA